MAVSLGTDHARRASLSAEIEQASGALFDDIEAVREHERIFSELLGDRGQGTGNRG
jgi:hypothetical protein